MIGIAIEGIIQFIFHVVVEIFMIGTGELILFILTFGKRTPVWGKNRKGGSIKLAIFIDFSFIIGFVFWLSLAWLIFN